MDRRFAPRWAWLCALVGSLAAASGCAPKIGDKCSISTDCSVMGDRLCDPAQPGGYCTVFNCEPNGCPDESVCVAFNEASCSSPALARRFQRTFCMFVCQSDSDCRAGYQCLDTTSDPARQVVDLNPQSHKICTVPPLSGSMPMSTPTVDPAVCAPADAAVPTGDAAVPTDDGAVPTGEAGSEAGVEAGAEIDSPAEAAEPGDGDASTAE